MEIEAFARPLNHALGSEHLCLTDRRRGLDVDDDRVVGVDQVISRIGEEGLTAMRAGPACRWIGRRDELRRDFSCCAECRVVKDGEILRNRAARRFWWQALVALDALLTAGFRLDQAAVDGEPFATHQSLLDAAAYDVLEEAAKQVAVAEPTVAVLGKGRVIWHLTIEPEPAEPTVGEIEMDLIAQPTLRADAEAIADNQHTHHQLGIDRWTAELAVVRRELPPQRIKLDEP